MEFLGGFKHLGSGVNELTEVSPSVIKSVFPLGNGGSISVACLNYILIYLLKSEPIRTGNADESNGHGSSHSLKNRQRSAL